MASPNSLLHRRSRQQQARFRTGFARALFSLSVFASAATLPYSPASAQLKFLPKGVRPLTWNVTSGATTYRPLAYAIVIDHLSPMFANQTINIHYTLVNLSGAPINGDVDGDIDGHALVPTASADIKNLGPKGQVSGTLWTYGRPAGTYTAHISFQNGRYDNSTGGFNPFDPKTFPHPTTPSPLLAEDTTEIVVGQIDPILTTTDAPAPGDATFQKCGGDKGDTFGFNKNVLKEWVSVLPGVDPITPFAGTVVQTENSKADFPFAHPFDKDTEFYAVPDPSFGGLLATSNKPSDADCQAPKDDVAEVEYCQAQQAREQLGISGDGILGFEVDQGLVPQTFRPLAGDRVAVHGTWIVDCGHPDYHAEMHPPLIIARAALRPGTGEVQGTIIGRPYTVTQEYQPDSAPFLPHAIAQLANAALNPVPSPIEAKPIIRNVPFGAFQIASYTFALPPQPGSELREAEARYHFIVRHGVAVFPSRLDKYHLKFGVFLDPGSYSDAPPPSCSTVVYSTSDIEKDAGWPDGTIKKITGAGFVGGAGLVDFLGVLVGIPPGTLEPILGKTALTLNAGVQKLSCTVPGAIPSSLPAPPLDNQIVEDDSQAFPIVGWVDMRYSDSRILQLSTRARRQLLASEVATVRR